ncbi:MAG TPA: substrate-binding domain-containing protein [Planctomycetota bacterium]|nr:substrate-binding domain-containing protein [Planctomycetota bacterium]
MKMLAMILALVAVQDRVSPDLLDYQPSAQPLKGILEVGPANGFETLLGLWTDRMKQHYPDLRGGKADDRSSTPKALTAGTNRIGILARRWTEAEVEDFRLHWGYVPTEIAVGTDALSIVVHPENPIASLPLELLDAIFSSTRRRGGREIHTWGDLGLDGAWKSRPIIPYGCGKDSPARVRFQERVLQGGAYRDGVKEVAGAGGVLLGVADDPGGIGYVGGLARPGSVRVVALRSAAGSPALEPQSETIQSLSYPLSWRIAFTVRRIPGLPVDADLAEFLKMVLSRDGQTILAGEGLVPVTGRFARKELLKLK